MSSTIIIKNSATSGSVPASLVQGEFAINVLEGKLYYGSGSGNTVKEFNTSSFALTASFVNPLRQTVLLTGSLLLSGSEVITGSLAISGSGSLLSVQGDEVTISGDLIEVTGSLRVTGSATIVGSLNASSITGSLLGTASWASNAITSSNALTASYVNPLRQDVLLTGSLLTTGSITLTGSANISANLNFPFVIVAGGTSGFGLNYFSATARQTNTGIAAAFSPNGNPGGYGYVFQFAANTTVGGNGLLLVGDNGTSKHIFGTSKDAAGGSAWPLVFRVGTASWAVAPDLMTLTTTQNVLIGTSTDAGYRLNVSGSGNFTDNLTVTGSFTVITGSSIEFQVQNTGVKIGNIITDVHTVTGSINISGSISASNANFGTITATSASITYLTTIYETASIIYSTGSNQFGDASDDVQTLWGTVDIKTGPVLISGSLITTGSNTLIGNTSLTGSLNITGSTTQIGNNNLLGNTTLSGSIIISGSTTTPTVQVYGNVTHDGYIRFNPVSTNIDNSISASYIYVSGSTNDLYFTQNGQGYGNTTRLRWLEGNLYTGLLHGGLLSATTGSTVFTLSSGSGIIVNLNASLNTDPYPTVQFITWPTYTSQSLTYLTSSIQTFLGIDSSGNIIQQTDPWNDGQYNTSLSIGTVLHQNTSSINGTITYPNVAYGYKQRTYDFIKAFGPLKLSGYTIFTSSSLGLTVGSGTAWADGRNYQTDPNNPSYITDPGTNVSKIFRYYVSGSTYNQDTNGGLGYTVIDPSLYNNNGVLTPISPSTPWSNQRVFWYPNSVTKATVVYYGSAVYASSTEAIANLPYENFQETPNTQQNAIYLGTITIKYNGSFTNPNDYVILPGGIFRNVGGSGGGGTVSTTLSGLSDVNISGPTNGQALIYNSSLLKWQNLSFFSGSISGNAATATTASFASSGTGTFSGSFSGSFQGNGSGLTNIPASGITGLNLSQIATGSVSASVSPGTSSFQVTSGSTNFLFVSSSGNIGIGTTTPTSAKLQVSGSTSALGLQGSGSGVFTVDGTSGRLFSVDDSLSGSLFSVNTAAGLPLIEAFSDNTVRIGQFGQRALFVSQSAVGIGVETLTAKLQVSGSNSERLLLVGSPASSSILFVTGSGLVGIGTNTPLALLSVGAGSLADTNLPIQISTGGSGTEANYGINKNGSYGFLFGYKNGTNIGSMGLSYVGGYFRNVTTDPFAIVMNNVTASALWTSDASVYIGGIITNSSTGAGSALSVRGTTGNVGVGTITPNAKLDVNGNTIITGSLTVITGSAIEFQVTNTGVKIGNASTDVNTVTGSLQVAGQTRISGSFNTAISGTILTVVGSGSTQPIFTVQGSQGELFSVTDSLTGSLFSVNDISGLPILEVFSDSTTNIGNYLAPAVYTTNKITQTNSGSFVVYSLPTASYDGAFYDYTVRSGSNARAGQIMAIWSGSSVNFTETTTTSFGSTSAINFTVIVSGSNMVLTGSSATGSWTIKTIIRSI